MPQSVKWSAYLCFFQVVGGIVMFALANGTAILGFQRASSSTMLLSLGFAYCILPIFILTFLLLGFGLLRGWGWARWGAIIVSLINMAVTAPVGTVLGIITIYLLFRPESRQAFNRIPA